MSQRRKKGGLVQPTITKKTTITKHQVKPKRKGLAPAFKSMEIVKQPLAVTRIIRKTDPIIRSGEKGVVHIKHREYMDNARGATNLGDTSTGRYLVNPGNAAVFPWCSQMARMFDSYKFNSLKFTLVACLGGNVNGNIAAYADGDVEDVTILDIKGVLQNENALVVPAWISQAGFKDLHVQKQILNRLPKYLVSRGSGSDVNPDYSVCSFNMFNNIGGGYVVCDIMVEYDLTLFNPTVAQIPTSIGQVAIIPSFVANGTFNGLGRPFQNFIAVSADTIPMLLAPTIGPAAGGIITGQPNPNFISFLEAGSYLLRWFVYGNGTLRVGGTPSGAIGTSIVPGVQATNGFSVPMTYAGTSNPWHSLHACDDSGSIPEGCFSTDAYTDPTSDPLCKYPNSEVRIWPLGRSSSFNPLFISDETVSYQCSVIIRLKGTGRFYLPFTNLIPSSGSATSWAWKMEIAPLGNSGSTTQLPSGDLAYHIVGDV